MLPTLYDLNGNLTSDGTTTYSWDARNQLAAITSASMTASFGYDPLGRRQGKTVNSAATQFLYDGLNPVQELNGPTIAATLLTGLGIDEYLTRTDATGASHYLTDALGSTVALTDATGSVPTTYAYEPFGATTMSGTATGNSFDYTGRENDGTGLKYYRSRYLHPGLQRFISEDPIGFAGGDVNLYAYVRNNPILRTDPLGLRIKWGSQVLNNPFVILNLYRLNQAIIDQGLADDSFTLLVTGGDRYRDCNGQIRSLTDYSVVTDSSQKSEHLIENGARGVDLRVNGAGNEVFDRALLVTDFSPWNTNRNYPKSPHTHIALPNEKKYYVPPDSLPPAFAGRKNTCGP